MFKKKIAVALMSLTATVSMTSQVFAAPTSASLGVDDELQQYNQWCWAASSVSILDYLGTDITQLQFVTAVKGQRENSPATDSEVQDGMEEFGYQSTLVTDMISWDSVKTEIGTNERPIYAGWSWKDGTGGHAVVLDGYDDGDDNYVEYMDPGYSDHFIEEFSWFRGKYKSTSDHIWDGTIYKIKEQ
ncbi:papain-like cysteine protease family protein [Brevibacillus migulae]|uniref:papain-like cysteine protease family protein n=1 Tax=Brevibacillus migulae TaxID=1644114 RepID=UPI001430A761|nr:papain-like cysteine protease family protein [Brevibacillus migulae]